MVVFNYSGKEINAKIVYYGPGLSGKTTNLEKIYGHVPEQRRGKMVSMKTRSDRTLFFDFLPVNAGEIKGFRTRFLLYTVPGQVHYNATRKLVLKGTDAIIFVADSDPALRQANIESMANLEQNLAEYKLSTEKIPVILQYNKRDLPNALTVEELEADLNGHGWPWFEAVSFRNEGVWETFRAATRALFESLEKTLGVDEEKEEKEKTATAGSGKKSGDDTDTRFDGNNPVFDLGSGVDDVVRLSGSLDSWNDIGGDETKKSSEKETESPVAAAGTGGERGENLGGQEEPKPPAGGDAMGGKAMPGGGYLPDEADRPGGYVQVAGALQDSGDRAPGEPGLEKPQARVAAPEAPPTDETARSGETVRVVHVPVQVDEERGNLRIEIVLELELTRKEKDRKEPGTAASLDSGEGWN